MSRKAERIKRNCPPTGCSREIKNHEPRAVRHSPASAEPSPLEHSLGEIALLPATAAAASAASGMTIRAKMTVRPPGDQYEEKADRVAAQVVQQIHAPAAQGARQDRSIEPQIQKNHHDNMMPNSSVNSRPESGIAISQKIEGAINQARGSGQPLSDSIREQMERSFGADFGEVRIHADAQSDTLNRSIRAKAFTTGQDVFFRHGAYEPETQRGQELIAHELAHVAQQRGGTNGVASSQGPVENQVQRKIGIELECTNLTITKHPKGVDKGAEIKKDSYNSWLMMYEKTSAGTPVVEFKTEPAAEDWEELQPSVRGMQEEAKLLNKTTPTQIGGYEITKERGDVVAAPQVSVGVPLESLPVIYKKFGDLSDTIAYQKYKKANETGKDPSGKFVKDLPDETKGFILLCIDYLQRGYVPKAQQEVQGNATDKEWKKKGRPFVKGIFDVMARSDFATIFKSLSDQEQNRISLKREDGTREMKPEWIEWFVKKATTPWDPLTKSFEIENALKSGQIEEAKKDRLINQKIKGRGYVGAGPKRGEWLKTMPETDLLARGKLMGLGKMGTKTDFLKLSIGDKAAPIFEIRSVETSSIPYTSWLERAGHWWLLYKAAINQIIKRTS